MKTETTDYNAGQVSTNGLSYEEYRRRMYGQEPMKTETTPVGNLMRLYRNNNRLGVRALAKEIGCSPATISRIERGNPPDCKNMVLLINWLFGVSP